MLFESLGQVSTFVHGHTREDQPLPIRDEIRDEVLTPVRLLDTGHIPPSTSVMVVSGRLSEEGALNWNKWVRQIHRWVSIAFTVTVLANFIALSQGTPPPWVTYSPLLPLALLLFSGLYLFVLPYTVKWRSGGR